MLARSLVCLAIVGCTAGQTAMPKGKGRGADGAGKGAGKGAGRGAPAPANLPELHILRDEMRRAWCAGGRNAAMTPCQMEAFMAKVKAESDPVKKKALTVAHVAEQGEKRNSKVKCPLGRPPQLGPCASSGRVSGGCRRLETPRAGGRATGRPTHSPSQLQASATDSVACDHLGARPTPPGPRPSIPRTSSACSTAPAFAENGWP